MAEKPSNVDQWLKRETPQIRQALESASRYVDENDHLTVNTLEAVYGRESSFGTMLRERGSVVPAGHFHFKPDTAKEYGLNISKNNDQRFDIDYASSAAARYLKDLDNRFREDTKTIIGVRNSLERQKFILAAYNGGPNRIADAQQRAKQAGTDPKLWINVEKFLVSEDTSLSKADEIRQYVERVLSDQAEFAAKSPADKTIKHKEPPRKGEYRCTEGHWVTIDDRPVYICD